MAIGELGGKQRGVWRECDLSRLAVCTMTSGLVPSRGMPCSAARLRPAPVHRLISKLMFV